MLWESGSSVGFHQAVPTMNASGLVVRTWNDAPISRRDSDGYADATAMCHANGKRWNHYQENERTAAYLAALGESLNLPTDQLVLTTTSGPNHLRGTWIHPRLAVDLARWLSPQFAVWMDGWFLEAAGQAQEAVAPVADGWDHPRWEAISRTSNGEQWLATSERLRKAQLLLWHEEQRAAGRSIATTVDLGEWFASNPFVDQINPGKGPGINRETLKQISSLVAKQLSRTAAIEPAPTRMEDLAAMSEWIIEAIHSRRSRRLTATTIDLANMSSCSWCRGSISNRLTELRRQGLVTKRHLGWHLTPAAERLLAAVV
jgi:hypothetical protein